LCSASYQLAADGTVLPLEGAGLGVEIDEEFLRAHPITEGPAWR
jgi:L-alanine-DL-glutamate epimerase-like enolase superfamily enzyme